MKQNQFIVDLGSLELTEDQRKSLNAAIHKAVAGELSNIGTAKNVGLFPVSQLPTGHGPIINGIIIRNFGDVKFKDLIK